MNAKNLKFMQLFEDFVKVDFLADKNYLSKAMKGFMDLDYLMAVDAWDYITTTREKEMSDELIAKTLGEFLFGIFYERASTKCIKAINDTLSIRKAIYQYSPLACSGDNFIVFTDLMVQAKTEQVDEILKCLIKNEHISFGEKLKLALERVFIELLKKNPAKIEMNKKLSALLLTYIKRIKTDERAMLEQRIRELG